MDERQPHYIIIRLLNVFLPKGKPSTKKLYFLLRKDLRKMGKELEQTKLLCMHLINTAKQLSLFIESFQKEIAVLTYNR